MEKTFQRLKIKPARESFVEAELVNGIAAQIRVLRKKNGWSQNQLAEKLGTSQGVISRIEDPSYGRLSFKTLLSIASLFDVALIARFLPFSQAVPATWDTRPEALEVDSFDEEVSRIIFYSKNTASSVRKFNSSSAGIDAPKRKLTATYDFVRSESYISAKSINFEKSFFKMITFPAIE